MNDSNIIHNKEDDRYSSLMYLKPLFALLLLLFCCFSAKATNPITINGLTYTPIEGTTNCSICWDYETSLTNPLNIPSTMKIDGKDYTVTTIADYAFSSCGSLTSVIIPDGVTSIGEDAFDDCSNLTSATIPNSATSIGPGAFSYCSNLASLDIPNGVTSIGNYTFTACIKLTSLTIPNSVTSIGNFAFSSCKKLTSLAIPNSVKTLGDYVFYFSGITSLTIPNGMTSIGEHAFDECSELKSITIPNSVTNIGKYAFKFCENLTSMTLSNGITTINEGTFFNCINLAPITIPNSVTNIDKYAFVQCCSPTSIPIPNSVINIDDSAFCQCSGLTSVIIPNSVTNIGEYAFGECHGLTSVTIPNSITSIADYIFTYCTALDSITIPNSITSIGKGAFEMSALDSITIPNSVTSIGDKAFNDCNNLSKVSVESPATTIGTDAFSDIAEGAKLYVPKCREDKTWTNYPIGDGGKLALTKREAPRDSSFTLAAGQLCSAYFHYPVDIPDGANAYTGTLNADKTELALTKITGKTIPAGTPFVLCKADGIAGTVTMTESNTDSYTPLTDNALQGSITLTAGLVMPFSITSDHYSFTAPDTAAACAAFLTPSQVNAGTKSVTMVVNRDIPANDYITLSYPFALDLTGKGEAFAVSAIGENEVTTTSVTSSVLAANQPVLLKGAAAASSLPVSSLAGTTVSSSNYLVATTGEAIPTTTNAYILAKMKNLQTGFCQLSDLTEERTVAENKAYLNVPVSGPSKAFYGFGNGTTAIDGVIQNAAENNEAYYTLQGVRVTNPTKGLFVKKGKVIILK